MSHATGNSRYTFRTLLRYIQKRFDSVGGGGGATLTRHDYVMELEHCARGQRYRFTDTSLNTLTARRDEPTA